MPAEPRSHESLAALRSAVTAAAQQLAEGADQPDSSDRPHERPADSGSAVEPDLSRPPKAAMGDYSSNGAMILAGRLGAPPREVAERLAAAVSSELAEDLERSEVAGPGFLNLHLTDGWHRRALAALLARVATAAPAGDSLFGLGPLADAETRYVSIEFVSANPTGPLTAASGRHAAYGDSVCRLLAALGHRVEREYYINDAGGQIDRFAASVAAAMTGDEPPEDGYKGAYVAELAARLAQQGQSPAQPDDPPAQPAESPVDPGDLDQVGRAAVELMLAGIRQTVAAYGVQFDRWVSERALHEAGAVTHVLERLTAEGRTYEQEGALWLRTAELGDDKDRVLVRAGGEPTYFAADLAYHADKLARGYDLLIDVLGADHHGYIGRMRAALAALGAAPEAFEAPIMQLVSIVEGGERTQMAKRSGEFVALDELIADIGADATRFFMLDRSHETPVDLDLELARRHSSDNPVYYVQYAHARIASILRKAAAESAIAGAGGAATDDTATDDTATDDDGGLTAAEAAVAGIDPSAACTPLEPAERALIKRLLEFPDEVREAAARRAPHRICAYATAIAADFHAFYRDCQVVGAEGERTQDFRLALSLATKRTLAASLYLLGITAPDRM